MNWFEPFSRWWFRRRMQKPVRDNLSPRERRLRRIDELYEQIGRKEREITRARVDQGGALAELDKLIYAEEGQWITCENGHPIARYCRTVKFGDAFLPDQHLIDWQQPMPETGVDLPLTCRQCGAPWAKQISGVKCAHHFEGEGWR